MISEFPRTLKQYSLSRDSLKAPGVLLSASFPPPRANMEAVSQLYYDPKVVADLSGDWDSVVVVAKDAKDLPASLASIAPVIEAQIKVAK